MNIAGLFPGIIAVVPAAGIGSRMRSEHPKQYLTIRGKTLLEYAIDSLLVHPAISRIIVAINPIDPYFAGLPIASDPRITVVTGGKERADSVLAGLQVASDARWVLVHDAARPCLHPDDLTRLLAITATCDVGGILAAPVCDTMKRAAQGKPVIAHTVDREALWHALTPQLFPLELLRDCLQKALREGARITDEASALEYCGYQPQLVAGRSDNIKVTRPEDLALAAFYLTQLNNKESA
ncbi:2-C-methyl-D-erythritol 4-phosphate cytidylyltransferase [Erwinia psidii]|uniref:2-C-methyl-D-erythritol 4-phosphate cytidylyltransferase n=1 Tax=Erwinia psidii TaxID=69224 RepID=A0A3N6SJK8_9GAMM|nr:2-C-methyl-D-erythritol 4-phosphate cytidylyltransferase [Erwinia psidii]MCX8956823.1 2-C-methyl-D-erythritol 4-phosphate cytidylyltransferase [Erwinia psidii]MCX8960366.1 2-C-methyl-D-erythritol 4-phosphate cytidylyltransferase [Erwinia psidii]MCX8964454.1 2-C-methyl-D-erythritol 4-phosphate cytidylyltransferase [Erwinia psidii]RQM40143.1 2-C-methyl-D-erythritol 4-phosphate cytidylyltransferase [Erwinia psidii]